MWAQASYQHTHSYSIRIAHEKTNNLFRIFYDSIFMEIIHFKILSADDDWQIGMQANEWRAEELYGVGGRYESRSMGS